MKKVVEILREIARKIDYALAPVDFFYELVVPACCGAFGAVMGLVLTKLLGAW